MSRLPPASIRLSCGALNYSIAGSSLAYFERQLKQNLANVRAWSPSAALFYNTGRLSRIRRKLLVHSCVNPIAGPLRSRSYFELMMMQSHAWYLKKFRGACAGLGFLGSAASALPSGAVQKPGQSVVVSAHLGVGDVNIGVGGNPRRRKGWGLSSPGTPSTHPHQCLGKRTVDTDSVFVRRWSAANVGVGLNSARLNAAAPVRLRDVSNVPDTDRPRGRLQPPATEVAAAALGLLGGAARCQVGYRRVNRYFDHDAWVGKPSLRLLAPSVTEPRRGARRESVTGLSLNVSSGVGLSHRPNREFVTGYTGHGPRRQPPGVLRKRVDELSIRTVYGVNPMPRLAFVRTYNARTALIKFSLISGHHQRRAGQYLTCPTYPLPSLRSAKSSPNTEAKRQRRVKVQALTSPNSNQSAHPSSAVIKCGFVRSKSRFTLSLARPDPIATTAVFGKDRHDRPAYGLSLRL